MPKPKIYTVEGDITQLPADALMTAVNSSGFWFGGIDGAIQRVAGDMYHSQITSAAPLMDLKTIVAKKRESFLHRGKFRDVVFVIDDLESPLNQVVYAGLEAASDEGYTSLLVPTIRMGVMSGVRETPEQAIVEMTDGLRRFVDKYSRKTKLEDIKVVIYNDSALARNVSSALKDI